MSEVLEEKLKNREQLILEQNKQIAIQKEVIEKLVEGLNDIQGHSTPPFKGNQWMQYVQDVSLETLAFAKEKLG